MRIVRLLPLVTLTACSGPGVQPMQGKDAAERLVADILAGNESWTKLEALCDGIGHRLSGSEGLERAVAWAIETMKADGQENVRAEKVMVPKWVRGRESAVMVEPRIHELSMLGLGGSIGTPPNGVTAEVVVVKDKEHLDRVGDGAKGKIVLFNYAMPPYDKEKGSRYGETVQYRGNGAAWAAEKGAVAALVRSVTAKSLRTPHTGMMRYKDGVPKIPTAAVTIEDAELMARLTARGVKVVVTLKMEARDEGLAESANPVGEIVGREKPEEIVLISGHLDSWDVGQGAQDDGGGCVMALEALRMIRKSGLRPRRTIRVVLWTNEENGMAGVRQYIKDHADELKHHVAVIESDSGTFKPVGFGLDHPDQDVMERAAARVRSEILPALRPIGELSVRTGGSSSDIGHFKPKGVLGVGLNVEGSTYFDTHHTPADTVDKVDPRILSECTAAMAALAWRIADAERRFDE